MMQTFRVKKWIIITVRQKVLRVEGTLGPIRTGSNLGLVDGLQAMNYAKDLSCYSHWHFGYDLSRCAHPTQRGQLSLNPVMPPPMARSNLRLWCPKLFGYLPPKYFQRNQRSVILFRLSILSRLPPWRFWSFIIFLDAFLPHWSTKMKHFSAFTETS